MPHDLKRFNKKIESDFSTIKRLIVDKSFPIFLKKNEYFDNFARIDNNHSIYIMNKTTKLICKDPYIVPAICVYLAQLSNTMCSSYGDPGKAGATRDIIVVDEEY